MNSSNELSITSELQKPWTLITTEIPTLLQQIRRSRYCRNVHPPRLPGRDAPAGHIRSSNRHVPIQERNRTVLVYEITEVVVGDVDLGHQSAVKRKALKRWFLRDLVSKHSSAQLEGLGRGVKLPERRLTWVCLGLRWGLGSKPNTCCFSSSVWESRILRPSSRRFVDWPDDECLVPSFLLGLIGRIVSRQYMCRVRPCGWQSINIECPSRGRRYRSF